MTTIEESNMVEADSDDTANDSTNETAEKSSKLVFVSTVGRNDDTSTFYDYSSPTSSFNNDNDVILFYFELKERDLCP